MEKVSEKTVVSNAEVDIVSDGITERDQGTTNDQRDMDTLGKTQVMRRTFNFITVVGFASTAMGAWEVLLPLFAFSLIDGGTALLFWGFIAAALVFTLVYASIAEMASIAPAAGGQYHFVSEFAPPKYQKLLSFIVGWLTAVGWQVYLAGSCFLGGTITQGLVALNLQDYRWHNWHGTLFAISFVVLAVVFNTVFAKRLPGLSGTALILHMIGPFVIGITLWCTATISDPKVVLLEFTNNGGWPTTGLASFLGLVTPLSTINGYDCAVHMSEEIRDASLVLPRSLMASIGLNCVLVFFLAVSLIFTLGDIDEILQTATRQPFIQVFYNATRSYAATTILTTLVLVLLAICCITENAATSRQIWSFARDGGLPFSTWLSKISPRTKTPVRAIWVSVIISSLLACINLGSTTAFNAINSLGAVSIMGSYFITIGCVIWRRLKGPPLPPHRWSLGRYGMLINVAALMGLFPLWFLTFWPLATPVTAATMNWSPAMFGGTVIFVSIFYALKARHVYTGPVVLVKRND